MDSNQQKANELMARGYRRTSYNHCMVSRVDREDWREVMAKEYGDHGTRCVKAMEESRSAADQYRRVFSRDTLKVAPGVCKLVHTSGSDMVGYIPSTADNSRR